MTNYIAISSTIVKALPSVTSISRFQMSGSTMQVIIVLRARTRQRYGSPKLNALPMMNISKERKNGVLPVQ